MNYLYHSVPRDMQGEVLHPLNTLKEKFPDAYEQHVRKYDGREHVLEQQIPLFEDCLWNDVLFTMAVRPDDLVNARREAGWPDRPRWQFYKIDPTSLDQAKLGVYLFTPGAKEAGRYEEDFVPYHYEDLARYSLIPDETKAYFRAELEGGKPFIPLLFRYIPHIIYRGEIDVSQAEIVTIHTPVAD